MERRHKHGIRSPSSVITYMGLIRRFQQISDNFVPYFEITHTNQILSLRGSLTNALEKIVDGAGNHARLATIVVTTQCKRFTTGCLPVCEDKRIVAMQRRMHQGPS